MKKLYLLLLFALLILSWCWESNEVEQLRNTKVKINQPTTPKKDLLNVPVIEEAPHEIPNYTIDWPISQ